MSHSDSVFDRTMEAVHIKEQQVAFFNSLVSKGFSVSPLMEHAQGEFIQFTKNGVTMKYVLKNGTLYIQYTEIFSGNLVWTDEAMGFYPTELGDKRAMIKLINQVIKSNSK